MESVMAAKLSEGLYAYIKLKQIVESNNYNATKVLYTAKL